MPGNLDGQAPDGGDDPVEDSVPPSGRAALLDALDVRRHAVRSLEIGVVAGVGVPLLFVGLIAGGATVRPLAYYAGLAFVVFVTVSMLAVGILTGRQVLATAVHPASIVRRTASGGLVAGLLWFATAGALVVGGSFRWVATLLAPAALLTLFGLWAVHTRYRRMTALRPLGALAAWASVAGILVVADLAAVDMARLLPEIGTSVDTTLVLYFRIGAGALVGGQVVQAVVAYAADRSPFVPVFEALPSVAGLAAYLFVGPGRTGLAVLALGLGVSWVVVSWVLRDVDDDAVPTADVSVA